MLKHSLTNGIKLIAEKLEHLHTLTIGVWVGVGSANELDQENGISHFIEHMVFKGTHSRTARDIAEEMDSIGASMNAFTSKNCTCFYVRTLDRDMYKGLEMLNDIVYRPAFDSVELEKERNVVLEEISMTFDTPEDLLSDIAASAVHCGPLSKPILGKYEQLKSYTKADITAYWRKHYTPNNIVISVVGNYDDNELIDSVEKLFSNAPNAEVNIEVEPNSLQISNSFYNRDIEQDHILLTYPAYPYNHKMEYALNIVNNILGGGMSSRIFQKIREEMGLAYSVYSYINKYKDIGTLCIYAGTNPQSANAVIDALIEQINQLKLNSITKKEFDSSRAQLMSSLEFSLESSAARMSRIGRALLLNADILSQEQILKMIDAVNMDDINNVIAHCFAGKPSISVVGPNAESVIKAINI